MREFVFRYFWVIALSLVIGVPYIKWTAWSLFDIIDSFKRTLKSRNNKLSLTEQMEIYMSEATKIWIIIHFIASTVILFTGGIMSFGYYLSIYS